jgi:hypothetical protein
VTEETSPPQVVISSHFFDLTKRVGREALVLQTVRKLVGLGGAA